MITMAKIKDFALAFTPFLKYDILRYFFFISFQALENVIAALRSINVTESELAAAKKAIKIDLEDASPAATLETMAVNLSLGAKEVIAPAQMVSMFEGVSLAEIQVRLLMFFNMTSIWQFLVIPVLSSIYNLGYLIRNPLNTYASSSTPEKNTLICVKIFRPFMRKKMF